MRCFRIPKTHLDHFLIFINLNVDVVGKPDYIFEHGPKEYDIVFTKTELTADQQNKIDKLVVAYKDQKKRGHTK